MLIESVLTTIPYHPIMVLNLNKKILKQVEKILRGSFGWAGRTQTAAIAMSIGPRFAAYCGILVWVYLTSRTRWSVFESIDFRGCALIPCDLGWARHAISREEQQVFDASTKMVVGD